jgi:hypothetical protein
MNATTTSNRRDFLTLLGLAFSLLLGGIYATRFYLMDDALITLRYSFNLARHGHAIWNQADASDPSLGYTTPLWMLLNAIPAFFTDNKDLLVLCCKLIGVIPLGVIVFFLVGPISRMPVPRLYRAAVVLVIFTQVIYGFHLNSGMETLLFSSLILLAVCSYAQDAPSSLGYGFGTLAFLTRPEGAIVVMLMLLWDLRRGRIKPAAVGGLGFALAALLLGLSLLTAYGTVLPNAFYIKQGGLSPHSIKATVSFLLAIALPYLPLAAYAVYSLKNTASRYCGDAAAVYLAYYMTVVPIMDVYSRYQWPILVLLTYASLPAFQKLGEAIVRTGSAADDRAGREIAGRRPAGPRQLALGLLALFLLVNVRSGLGSSHLARRAGIEERNLIALGKVMASHRNDRRWMAYCDAGAVCYYSDWNTYDTVGLNTRKIATKSLTPMQAYGNPSTDLVLLNCGDDPEWEGVMSWRESKELGDRLTRLGYRYAGSVPIRTEGAKRPWVVALYGRSLPRAKVLLRGVQVAPEVPPSPLERARGLFKRMAKGPWHSPAAPRQPGPTLQSEARLPGDKPL